MSESDRQLGPALDEAEVRKAEYAEVREKLRETEERVMAFMFNNIVGNFPVGSRENIAQRRLYAGMESFWGKPEYGDITSEDPARIYYSRHKNVEGSLFVDFVIDGVQYSVQLRWAGARQMALYSGDKELICFHRHDEHVPYYVDREHLCDVSPDGRVIRSVTSYIHHPEAVDLYWHIKEEAEAKAIPRIRGKLAKFFEHTALGDRIKDSRELALSRVIPEFPYPTPIYEEVIPMDEMLHRLELMRVGLEIMMDAAQRTLDESEPVPQISHEPTIDDEGRLLA